VKSDNPEVTAARAKLIPVVRRAEMLAELMRLKAAIAIGGTHGKTTTTSMIAALLDAAHMDPTVINGGIINAYGTNARLGASDWMVVEADESDGSFLAITPRVAVVTNVEADHLDHWADLASIEDAFVRFCAATKETDGVAVLCVDDPGARRVAERARAEGVRVVTYGQSADADVRIVDPVASDRGWSFSVMDHGMRRGTVALQVPGMHNALNAAAAWAVVSVLGAPVAEAAEGLEAFTGTQRRFELRGQVDGIRVYDDYAHHPTEVEVTLRAAREVAGEGRVVVAFQSHRYTRTSIFALDFGRALGLADEVVVLEVYSAGEQPIPGASGAVIAAAVPLPADRVHFEPSWAQVPRVVVERARTGDVVLTMGAGDVGLLAPQIVEMLRERA
jgi:UDP-N-acetylmuramate--alanine ligase